jgi:hypothetical protein
MASAKIRVSPAGPGLVTLAWVNRQGHLPLVEAPLPIPAAIRALARVKGLPTPVQPEAARKAIEEVALLHS